MDDHIDTAREIYELGLQAKIADDFKTACDHFNKAIELDPSSAPYRLSLALTLCDVTRKSEGLRSLAYFHAVEAAKLAPEILHNWIGLGEISLSLYRYPEARAAFERALELDDKNHSAWAQCGFANSQRNDHKRARECYEQAIKLDPEIGDYHFLMSVSCMGDDFDAEKIAYHGERGCFAKKPAKMVLESMWNSAHGYLHTGDYQKAWNYFEARLRRSMMNEGTLLPEERFPKPLWRGEKNCRVLVSAEMGMGDAFLMMRFLPIVQERFEIEVLFECMPSMMDLASYSLPNIHVIEFGHADPERFDYHLPMMSLPFLCKTKSYQIPWDGAYIDVPDDAVAYWEERLEWDDKPNIGVCWAGGSRAYNAQNHETDKKRSVPFDKFKKIMEIPGINFISLQDGPQAKHFANPGIRDFTDTAAIIDLMDAVITVDTAVANLAGAMGKETWLLNRFDGCWRWSKNLKTPWFPSVRVITQPKAGDWDAVISQITNEVIQWRAKIAA